MGSYAGLMQVMDDPRWAYAALITTFSAHVASHYVHLLFLSTLPSPLVRPLRIVWVRAVLGVAFAVWVADIVLRPQMWDAAVVPASAVGTWVYAPGPLYLRTWWILDLLWWFGTAVGITAFLTRGAWSDRRQAKAYLAAFVVHDGGFALALAVLLFFPPSSPAVAEWMTLFPWPLLNVWLTLLLAYGILRTQLFDIDLRLKWTLRQGTVGAAFLAVFLVVSQLVQNYANASLGLIGGAAAAGLLLFALSPLQRVAERLAHAAIPVRGDDAEYVAFRKVEVYKGTLEEMARDGELSAKDRSVLASLRTRLQISTATAAAVERDVLGEARPG